MGRQYGKNPNPCPLIPDTLRLHKIFWPKKQELNYKGPNFIQEHWT